MKVTSAGAAPRHRFACRAKQNEMCAEMSTPQKAKCRLTTISAVNNNSRSPRATTLQLVYSKITFAGPKPCQRPRVRLLRAPEVPALSVQLHSALVGWPLGTSRGRSCQRLRQPQRPQALPRP